MNRLPRWRRDARKVRGNEGPEREERDGAGRAIPQLLISLGLVLGLVAAMMSLVGSPAAREARAMAGDPAHSVQNATTGKIICVATSGEDRPDCGTEGNPCRTVQYAAYQAQPGDEIRVAEGTYTGTNTNGGLSQVAFLTETLTIRGGYSTANWNTPDIAVNPTTLDAEGNGRVLVISDTITVHVEGLRLEGGNASGLGGGPVARDAGGGLYILTGTVTISKCTIFSNTGSTTGPGYGGGIYVRDGAITLRNSKIISNTAGTNVYGYGGGLYLDHGNAILVQNKVMSNTASFLDAGYGGGLYLDGTFAEEYPTAILLGNTLWGNYGSRTADGQGGGMYANHYHVELLDNLIQYNTGGAGDEGKGGGLYIFFSDALLEGNLVRYNIASRGEEGISGGVHFCTCPDVTLKNNTIFSNTANTHGNGYGGGVSFCKTTASLDSNAIISNTATFSTALDVRGWGGGVWTGDRASLSFSNDLIAGNHAKTQGGGLWLGVERIPANPEDRPVIHLQHVTIADNRGDYYEHGVYVTNTVAFLTNTIIAGHADFGIYVATGGEATLEATLWYSNSIDHTYGNNTRIGDRNFYGDPAFADPGEWDYHIGEGSAALDRGVVTGVRGDMDGERRPWLIPDLGADEYWPPDVGIRAYLPLVLRQ